MSPPAWLSRALFAGAIAVLLAFWVTYTRANALEEAYVTAYPNHLPPPLLNGFRFSPDGVRPSSRNPEGDSQPRQHRLVFVLSDSCPACVRQAVPWTEMLSQASLQHTALSVFSFDGDELVTRLAGVARARGAPFASFTVENRDAFITSTGVSATPRVLLLDHENRIRLSVILFDAAAISELISILDESSVGAQ